MVGNGCSVPALQASRISLTGVSRASARDARSSPGCYITGFQPETGRKMSNLKASHYKAEPIVEWAMCNPYCTHEAASARLTTCNVVLLQERQEIVVGEAA